MFIKCINKYAKLKNESFGLVSLLSPQILY